MRKSMRSMVKHARSVGRQSRATGFLSGAAMDIGKMGNKQAGFLGGAAATLSKDTRTTKHTRKYENPYRF